MAAPSYVVALVHCISVRITNDGRPPATEIVPRGGLRNLYRHIMDLGGMMEIQSKPCFALTLVLSVMEVLMNVNTAKKIVEEYVSKSSGVRSHATSVFKVKDGFVFSLMPDKWKKNEVLMDPFFRFP